MTQTFTPAKYHQVSLKCSLHNHNTATKPNKINCFRANLIHKRNTPYTKTYTYIRLSSIKAINDVNNKIPLNLNFCG